MADPHPNTDLTSFGRAAGERLRAVQAALTDLLAGAGVRDARPTEVGRRLGLDKTLAWKISRFVESADPVRAFRHMPGTGGVEIVLRAAGESGLDGAVVERVRRSESELRALIRHHAGDRRTFEAMLAGERAGPRGELDERRSYFRTGSALWGVRARMQFLMLALRPSEQRPGFLDALQVSGLVDFERLRADTPWIVRRLRAHSDSGAEVFRMRREPLVAERAARALPPLFDRYCSEPLPELRQFERANGWVYDELAPGRIGREGAVTVVLGERYIGAVPMEQSEDNREGSYSLTVRTPAECVLFDLLLHRDLTHFGEPRCVVHGLLEDRPPESGPRAGASAPDPVRPVGLGSPAVVQTHRLATYAAMVDDALDLSGFGLRADFRGYRSEFEFPVFPCDIKMLVDIGARR